MIEGQFDPTLDQQEIIRHDGSAFVSACPGAGKTRVMVERTRHLFHTIPDGRGIAFLSFTRATIFELETRLRQQALLPSPIFPNFIGTFDSFVWQFLIAPFGLTGVDICPRLIPDMNDWDVIPYNGAQALPLYCFSPISGDIDQAVAKRKGFDVSKKDGSNIQQYLTAAKTIRTLSRKRGEVGFDEARTEALERIKDVPSAPQISRALSARFFEVIVDEAQDCNPDDLTIISWLRDSGISVKIICDPHQSIYGFRGGVTDDLITYKNNFNDNERKILLGNFRSSGNICKAISQLRPPSDQSQVDEPLGEFKDIPYPIYVLSYEGKVTPSIGEEFCKLVKDNGEDVAKSPVLAATRESGAVAVGQPVLNGREDLTFRLAKAVMNFHIVSSFDDVKYAIEETHKIILEIKGLLSTLSYHQYVSENEVEPETWRPEVVKILQDLRYDPTVYTNARAWHGIAKNLLSCYVSSTDGISISQKLRWNSGIETLLSITPTKSTIARTIHSVKGMEFPAVCVVTTTTKLKSILDFLETGAPLELAEDARLLYVAASRAQKLLVFAAPKSQANRLSEHLRKQGANAILKKI